MTAKYEFENELRFTTDDSEEDDEVLESFIGDREGAWVVFYKNRTQISLGYPVSRRKLMSFPDWNIDSEWNVYLF